MPETPEAVARARVRARQRLIGAAVLLMVGLVVFPMLFESQPRPVPVDLPIVIPSRDAAPLSGAKVSVTDSAHVPTLPQAVIEPSDGAASGLSPVPATAAKALSSAPPQVPTASAPGGQLASETPKVAVKSAERPLSKPMPPAEPRAASALKGAEPPIAKAPEPAASEDRFVVQVGAYAEAAGAHEVRLKVEALGMKTYTQVIEPASGRRIRVRVGPFATRVEAEKAAGKLRAAGLAPAILTL